MDAEERREQARTAYDAGEFRRSLDLLAPLLEGAHEDAQTLLIAAQCQMQLGATGKAADIYRQLADLQPASRDMFLQLAGKLVGGAPAPTALLSGISASEIHQMLTSTDRRNPDMASVISAFEQARFYSLVEMFETHLASARSSAPSPGILAMAAHAYEHLNDTEKAAHYYAHAGKLPSLNQRALLKAAFSLFQNLFTRKGLIPDLGIETARLLIERDPENLEAARYYRFVLQATCAIDDLRAYNARVLNGLKRGVDFFKKAEVLHSHLCWCADETINASIEPSVTYAPFTPASRQARRRQPHTFGEKIRIGYLTSDLYAEHPTSLLFKGVLAAHDPAKFDVTIFCFANRDFSDADRAFRKTLSNLITIGHLGAEAAAKLIRNHGIDILVDLKGPTSDAWPDLVNAGPAPIQAAWLGFPGSGNGIDCDYVISDQIVTPESARPHYHEKFCRLPETYQCNDAFTRPLPDPRGKMEMGVSPDTFLFASFNGMNKLSPQIVDLWAEILKRVENAKLALFCSNDRQRSNFLAAMNHLGLNQDRFIFWPRASYEEHLARIPAADIGLDCYPYNGHTTTSDMLWMGLPLITFKGSNFASRVSESLLKAIGMEKLVAEDQAGFIELAVSLANDPGKLGALRDQIAENRFRMPLFDTERFTRHLECAFEMMIKREKSGLEPEHIDVPALPLRTNPFP